MNPNDLKPNVPALQTSLLDLFDRVNQLMDRTVEILGPDDETAERAKDFEKIVKDERKKVEQMELVMVVAAPMKAGKSTIINALVGQEVLPNRAAAMTTLPTEVVFGEQQEPILTLSDPTFSLFKETWIGLKKELTDQSKIAQAMNKIKQYAHLEPLLREIEQKEELPIAKNTSGCDNLIKTLTLLNDLVRLSNLINESANPLPRLGSIPRIETCFWRTPKTDESNSGITLPHKGKLVIVDTPGPNEAGQDGLAEVVKEQLEKSSIVLLVLDFTGLNTETADQIKKDVQKVIEQRSTDNLYVLVNKVDQRQSRDMSSDELMQFVRANLELVGFNSTDRVFECSARRAFAAAESMQKLRQPQNTCIIDDHRQEIFNFFNSPENTRSKSDQHNIREQIKQLADILYVSNELDREQKKQLQPFVEKLWDGSGFELFLTKITQELIKRAVPKIIDSAIHQITNFLKQFSDDVLIRSRSNTKDLKELQKIIQALEKNLSELDNCRNELLDIVDKIKQELQQQIDKSLNDMYFEAENKVKESFNNILQNDIVKHPDLLMYALKTGNVMSTGKFEFNSYDEAEQFLDNVYEFVKDDMQTRLNELRREIKKKFKQANHNLLKLLDEKTQPILENAQANLKETFGEELQLPTPEIKNQIDDFVKSSSNKYIRQEKKTVFEEKLVKRRTWWHWFFLVPVEVKEKVIHKNDHWTVTKEDLLSQISRQIKTNVDRIKQNMNQFIEQDFQEKVDDYFEELNNYLNRYNSSLKQALQDRQLAQDQKNELLEKLNSLHTKAQEHKDSATTYLQYAKDLQS